MEKATIRYNELEVPIIKIWGGTGKRLDEPDKASARPNGNPKDGTIHAGFGTSNNNTNGFIFGQKCSGCVKSLSNNLTTGDVLYALKCSGCGKSLLYAPKCPGCGETLGNNLTTGDVLYATGDVLYALKCPGCGKSLLYAPKCPGCGETLGNRLLLN